MFYDLALLCKQKGGSISIAWIIATVGTEKFSKKIIAKVNTSTLCDEIQKFIQNVSNVPRQRLSLRLAAVLMNGVLKIHRLQCNYLYDDVGVMMTSINFPFSFLLPLKRRRRMKPDTTPDVYVEDLRLTVFAKSHQSISPTVDQRNIAVVKKGRKKQRTDTELVLTPDAVAVAVIQPTPAQLAIEVIRDEMEVDTTELPQVIDEFAVPEAATAAFEISAITNEIAALDIIEIAAPDVVEVATEIIPEITQIAPEVASEITPEVEAEDVVPSPIARKRQRLNVQLRQKIQRQTRDIHHFQDPEVYLKHLNVLIFPVWKFEDLTEVYIDDASQAQPRQFDEPLSRQIIPPVGTTPLINVEQPIKETPDLPLNLLVNYVDIIPTPSRNISPRSKSIGDCGLTTNLDFTEPPPIVETTAIHHLQPAEEITEVEKEPVIVIRRMNELEELTRNYVDSKTREKQQQRRIIQIVKNWNLATQGGITIEDICEPPICRKTITSAFGNILMLAKLGFLKLNNKPDSSELGHIQKGDRLKGG